MRIPPELPTYLLWFYGGYLAGAMAERFLM